MATAISAITLAVYMQLPIAVSISSEKENKMNDGAFQCSIWSLFLQKTQVAFYFSRKGNSATQQLASFEELKTQSPAL